MRGFLGAGLVLLLATLLAVRTDAQAAPAKSSFTVRYGSVTHEAFRDLREALVESRVLEEIAAALDSVFVLASPVELAFDQCGEENAFYSPELRSVAFCYEMFDLIAEAAAAIGEDDDQVEGIIAGTFTFVLVHELGHALIDVLDLPITGREEDAADQLAVISLLEDTTEAGAVAVTNAALFFLRLDPRILDELAFADEHSLGRQRFFNIVCWVYGQNPTAQADLVSEGVLPPSRATQCPAEYRRMANAWEAILAPFMR